MSEEPKPCPECSKKPVVTGADKKWVECRDCLTSGPAKGTRDKAIAAWNRLTVLPEGLQDDVLAFARVMQHKLDKNAHKNGWPDYDEDGNRTWREVDSEFLKAKLLEEMTELFMALCDCPDPDEAVEEAADVGNLAMMLAAQNGLQRIAAAPKPEDSQQ